MSGPRHMSDYAAELLREVEKPRPTPIAAAELLGRELPPPRWAVPGVLPEGVTILAGKPKMGKSWLGLGLCLAVAAGGVALGKIAAEKGGALYLGLEDNERRLQRRLKKVLSGRDAPVGLDLYWEWPNWTRAARSTCAITCGSGPAPAWW